MNDPYQYIQELYRKFLNGQCNAEELHHLLNHFEEQGTDSPLLMQIREQLEKVTLLDEGVWNRAQHIVSQTDKFMLHDSGSQTAEPSRSRSFYRAAMIAAMLLVVCSAGVLYWFNHDTTQTNSNSTSPLGADALPGGNRATLSLSDGSHYKLNEKQAEILVKADGIRYSNGTPVTQKLPSETATISTPAGGRYAVILTDGSKVWLNSSSSLKYPTNFNSKANREVFLTGEAYFEIAHNQKQPFIVHSKQQRVRVLGTEFNINAYDNEPTLSTTLLQGSIELSEQGAGEWTKLVPGQQANWNGSKTSVSKVQTEQFVAWKNGEFKFTGLPLPAVLRQLERWYDISVDYNGVPDTEVYASIRRDKNLSSVLYALSRISDLHFELSERRLRIRK